MTPLSEPFTEFGDSWLKHVCSHVGASLHGSGLPLSTVWLITVCNWSSNLCIWCSKQGFPLINLWHVLQIQEKQSLFVFFTRQWVCKIPTQKGNSQCFLMIRSWIKAENQQRTKLYLELQSQEWKKMIIIRNVHEPITISLLLPVSSAVNKLARPMLHPGWFMALCAAGI